jgi:hypothetical protein
LRIFRLKEYVIIHKVPSVLIQTQSASAYL